MIRISVVVMAFNESESLESVFSEIYALLSKLGVTFEILIVDDGSIDGTGKLADDLAEKFSEVRIIHHTKNRGLGGVYRTGFSESRGEFLTFFPADGQFPANIIEEFLPEMDNADMVLGYLPDKKRSLLAQILSAAEKLLFRIFFGYFPNFQGIVMFRRNLIDKIKLKSAGRAWTILMELIIRASKEGYRTANLPIKMRPRMYGSSKVNNFSTIFENLKEAAALRRNF